MKVLLIVNSSASSVTARRRVIIGKILSADHDVDVVETNRRGHATKLALDAATNGTEVVVCLGGDGTLNEIANGLVGTECALAALPGGSTNVFSRAIGLPDEPTDAALVISEALAAGSIRRIGLGSVNGRYFLFHVGIGWDAALVKEVEKRSSWKRYAGHALFIAGGIQAFFFTYDRKHPHFRVLFDDGTTIEQGYFDICLNLNPYTFVGNRPFNVAPDATLDRGLTNISVDSLRTVPFLRLMSRALRGENGLRGAPGADYRTDLTSMRVEAFGAVPYQVDGDHLGEIETLDFAHHPEIMSLVLPTGAALP